MTTVGRVVILNEKESPFIAPCTAAIYNKALVVIQVNEEKGTVKILKVKIDWNTF